LPDELIREVKAGRYPERTVKDLVADFIRQELGMAPHGQAEKRPLSSKVKMGGKRPAGNPVRAKRSRNPNARARTANRNGGEFAACRASSR